MRKYVFLLMLSFGLQGHAEKTFVYCSEASPSTFNPQLGDDGPTFNASSSMLYDRLLDFAPGTTRVIPGLAQRWEISPDGKVYTFYLREGVKFHTTPNFKPSRPFSAEDVIFTFMRALDKNHPYHKIGGGNYIFYQGMGFDHIIKKISKVDALTVRFELAAPEAPFLADLAMSFAAILSSEYADKMWHAGTPERVDLEPVGTGPFVLRRYIRDDTIRYLAFADYWRGHARLDQVVFAITPESSVRYQKLKAGECQLVAEPAPQDIPAMKSNDKLQVVSRPGANIGYLAFNTEKAPFNRVLVRQAIAHALNRQSYIDLVFKGSGIVAKSPLPPTIWSYDERLEDYNYDPEKAKALLTEAGFANGFTTELSTLPVSRPYNPNGKKMGELMQADLAKVGIQVKLTTYDWPTYLARGRNGEFQLAQFGWVSDNGDPDNFMNILLSCAAVQDGGNTARWCDHSYDQTVTRAKTVSSIAERTKYYIQAQELFKKAAPWVTLAHGTVYRGLTRNVRNYVLSPLGTEDFYPLDLE